MTNLQTGNIPSQTDITIIGLGPAGATASMFLAKMGIPHLAVDASAFPRDKICGDGLDTKVFRVLNLFNPNLTVNEVFKNHEFLNVEGVHLIAPNLKTTIFESEARQSAFPYPIYVTAKRFDFDNFLVRQIDRNIANLQFEAKVTNIEKIDNGFILSILKNNQTYQVKTRLLLGADGEHSIVVRKLDDRKIIRNCHAAALRCYYRGITDMPKIPLLEIYFPKKAINAYFWIFPLPNGEANVGFGMRSDFVSKKNVNLREYFADLIKNDPFLAPRFRNAEALESPRGWGLPLATRPRRLTGDNYLILGDAASLVNPLSGEGIGTGMISGYIAAQFAAKAIKNQCFTANFLKDYEPLCRHHLKQEIAFVKITDSLKFELWRQPFLNFLVSKHIYPNYFKKNHIKWLETAFTKPIKFEL